MGDRAALKTSRSSNARRTTPRRRCGPSAERGAARAPTRAGSRKPPRGTPRPATPPPVDVVVDSAERHRRADRIRGRVVDPGVRGDEQGALRVRVKPADVLEKLAVSRPPRTPRRPGRAPLAAVLVQLGECPQRVCRIAEALDPVVAAVPLRQLRGDVLERVFVDREQDGERTCHPVQLTARQALGALGSAGGRGRRSSEAGSPLQQPQPEAAQAAGARLQGADRRVGYDARGAGEDERSRLFRHRRRRGVRDRRRRRDRPAWTGRSLRRAGTDRRAGPSGDRDRRWPMRCLVIAAWDFRKFVQEAPTCRGSSSSTSSGSSSTSATGVSRRARAGSPGRR